MSARDEGEIEMERIFNALNKTKPMRKLPESAADRVPALR